jgi:acetoacetyl-CoA reductase
MPFLYLPLRASARDVFGEENMAKKIALVTGGVGGIGSAICIELAQKGMKVFAGYHPSEQAVADTRTAEWKKANLDITVVPGDVSKYDSCAEMAKKTGPVDVLVNCAGITKDSSFKKMTEDQWYAVILVDLSSVFNVTKQYIDAMTEKGYGRIINISSVNGKRGQFGQTNYSAAKAGIHGFSMALAQETARKGVTVNSVSPGYTETAMTKAIDPKITEQIIAQVPMGRMAQPEEIAYTVGFLADERAAYITGANISVNGGLFISF